MDSFIIRQESILSTLIKHKIKINKVKTKIKISIRFQFLGRWLNFPTVHAIGHHIQKTKQIIPINTDIDIDIDILMIMMPKTELSIPVKIP